MRKRTLLLEAPARPGEVDRPVRETNANPGTHHVTSRFVAQSLVVWQPIATRLFEYRLRQTVRERVSQVVSPGWDGTIV
jgi:hypothetical protein